jgi:lysophospholipase
VENLTEPAYLKGIKTPILLCSGSADKISDPSVHAKVAKLLPNARFFSIANGRHELMRESDDLRNLWFARVYKFLDHDN